MGWQMVVLNCGNNFAYVGSYFTLVPKSKMGSRRLDQALLSDFREKRTQGTKAKKNGEGRVGGMLGKMCLVVRTCEPNIFFLLETRAHLLKYCLACGSPKKSLNMRLRTSFFCAPSLMFCRSA